MSAMPRTRPGARHCPVTGVPVNDCDCGACDDEPDGDDPDAA